MGKFKQLTRQEINRGRFAVVSETVDGKISLAQQLKARDDDGNEMFVFLKNAFLFQDKETFIEFIEQLEEVKEKIEENE